MWKSLFLFAGKIHQISRYFELCWDLRIQRQTFAYATNWTCLLVQDLESSWFIQFEDKARNREWSQVQVLFNLQIFSLKDWKVVEARYLRNCSHRVSPLRIIVNHLMKLFPLHLNLSSVSSGNHLFTLKMENYLETILLKCEWKTALEQHFSFSNLKSN